MQAKPFNLDIPIWTLLEAALIAASLPPATISEWMWMGEWTQGEHSYKHRNTRSYARLSLTIGRTESARRVLSARGAQPAVCAECGSRKDMIEYRRMMAHPNSNGNVFCCHLEVAR